MILPVEYNSMMSVLRTNLCTLSDKYSNLSDYGIQKSIDKWKLAIVYTHYEYMSKAKINPIETIGDTHYILQYPGQILTATPDSAPVTYQATKEYDEAQLLTSIKVINSILASSHVINIYEDNYKQYN